MRTKIKCFNEESELIEFITNNIDKIYALKYCLVEGNSHDEFWQYKYIVCNDDFKVNDKPSTYVSAPVAMHINRAELLPYVENNKYVLFGSYLKKEVEVYIQNDI